MRSTEAAVRATMAITRNDFNLTYPTNDLLWLKNPVPLAFGETTKQFNSGDSSKVVALIGVGVTY